MGAVYRAWQKSVDREVAIKLIHARSRAIRWRASLRARGAAREQAVATEHRERVRLRQDGRRPAVLAMELIRGRTLHRVLTEGGPFPLARVVRVGTQMCDALEAPRLGIVHRDLKLENVILLDERPGEISSSPRFRPREVRGDIHGTAAACRRHAALHGARNDDDRTAVAASDVYALGVMLSELAMGFSPWQGDSLGELLQRKLAPRRRSRTCPCRCAASSARSSSLPGAQADRRADARVARVARQRSAAADLRPPAPVEAATVPGKSCVRSRRAGARAAVGDRDDRRAASRRSRSRSICRCGTTRNRPSAARLPRRHRPWCRPCAGAPTKPADAPVRQLGDPFDMVLGSPTTTRTSQPSQPRQPSPPRRRRSTPVSTRPEEHHRRRLHATFCTAHPTRCMNQFCKNGKCGLGGNLGSSLQGLDRPTSSATTQTWAR